VRPSKAKVELDYLMATVMVPVTAPFPELFTDLSISADPVVETVIGIAARPAIPVVTRDAAGLPALGI
jgi:hypothetical protein